jgi:hypothetical protein
VGATSDHRTFGKSCESDFRYGGTCQLDSHGDYYLQILQQVIQTRLPTAHACLVGRVSNIQLYVLSQHTTVHVLSFCTRDLPLWTQQPPHLVEWICVDRWEHAGAGRRHCSTAVVAPHVNGLVGKAQSSARAGRIEPRKITRIRSVHTHAAIPRIFLVRTKTYFYRFIIFVVIFCFSETG